MQLLPLLSFVSAAAHLQQSLEERFQSTTSWSVAARHLLQAGAPLSSAAAAQQQQPERLNMTAYRRTVRDLSDIATWFSSHSVYQLPSGAEVHCFSMPSRRAHPLSAALLEGARELSPNGQASDLAMSREWEFRLPGPTAGSSRATSHGSHDALSPAVARLLPALGEAVGATTANAFSSAQVYGWVNKIHARGFNIVHRHNQQAGVHFNAVYHVASGGAPEKARAEHASSNEDACAEATHAGDGNEEPLPGALLLRARGGSASTRDRQHIAEATSEGTAEGFVAISPRAGALWLLPADMPHGVLPLVLGPPVAEHLLMQPRVSVAFLIHSHNSTGQVHNDSSGRSSDGPNDCESSGGPEEAMSAEAWSLGEAVPPAPMEISTQTGAATISSADEATGTAPAPTDTATTLATMMGTAAGKVPGAATMLGAGASVMCASWCFNACAELTGNVQNECGACSSQGGAAGCYPGAAGFGELPRPHIAHDAAYPSSRRAAGLEQDRDRARSQSLRHVPPTAEAECAVIDMAHDLTAAEVAHQLAEARRPVVLRNLVRSLFDGILPSQREVASPSQEEAAPKRPSRRGARRSLSEVRPAPTPVVSCSRFVGLHQHGPTLNVLLRGSRHWFIVQPRNGTEWLPEVGGAGRLLRALAHNRTRCTRIPGGNVAGGNEGTPLPVNSSLLRIGRLQRTGSSRDWLRFVYPSHAARLGAMRTFECMQHSGEVIFLPSAYAHGVVSLGPIKAVYYIAQGAYEDESFKASDLGVHDTSGDTISEAGGTRSSLFSQQAARGASDSVTPSVAPASGYVDARLQALASLVSALYDDQSFLMREASSARGCHYPPVSAAPPAGPAPPHMKSLDFTFPGSDYPAVSAAPPAGPAPPPPVDGRPYSNSLI